MKEHSEFWSQIFSNMPFAEWVFINFENEGGRLLVVGLFAGFSALFGAACFCFLSRDRLHWCAAADYLAGFTAAWFINHHH